VGYFLLFLLFVSILFSIPAVQTKLGGIATKKLNQDFNTRISIKKVDLSFLGNVQLEGIEIRDHHQDTLIFVNELKTSIFSFKNSIQNKFNLGNVSLDGVYVYMKTYQGESRDNMAVFVNSFGNDSQKDSVTSPFTLSSPNMYINNLNYKLINENAVNPVSFSAKNGGASLQEVFIYGPDFSSKIRGLYFEDNKGLEIKNLSTDFKYSKTAMNFKNTILQTRNSEIKATIDFSYKIQDLSSFNDKVHINATFDNSVLSLPDLKKYYSELEGNDVLYFSGDMNGKLNDFSLDKLRLSSKFGIGIIGDFNFLNAVNHNRGFTFNADVKTFSATYFHLRTMLPNVLGTVLPSASKKLGKFSMKGTVALDPNKINASFDLASQIGHVSSELEIHGFSDEAAPIYDGKIQLKNFDLGVLLNNPLFGKTSFQVALNGQGFEPNLANTSFNAKVSKLNFKKYTYKNIDLEGLYKNKRLDGSMKIEDEYFKTNLNGFADLSSSSNKFDFNTEIKYLNLKETKLYERDTISILKGNVKIDLEGNAYDNIIGKLTFDNISYENQLDQFNFKQFNLTSSLKNNVKKIELKSEDIANGYLSGNFYFSELFSVAQNSLGEIYTNYKPYIVKPNQFFDFNFTIYNQIVSVFFSEISIDDTTKIKGKIKTDNNQLRLKLSSPKIDFYGNEIRDLFLRTDNQNPLYNSHVTASKVRTKYYNVSELNLLSLHQNDTLFFKSVFTGGNKKKEDFNLDFFYTFNATGKSVIGFDTSSFKLKDNIWNISPNESIPNKVTFDLKENEFNFSKFKLVSGTQKVTFQGSLNADADKELFIDFTKVKLESFLPTLDSLALKGALSGSIDLVQREGIYNPKALLTINDFDVNGFYQGDLSLRLKGDNSYEKYTVDLSIDNRKVKSIEASGFLDFSDKRPLIDLEVYLEEFGLDAFSPLGKDVLSSIRGTASGNFSLSGFLGNPAMDGAIKLKNAGLKFPYLNVNYDFEVEPIVRLKEQSFIFEDFSLLDTKYKTEGILKGNISHKNFNQWVLEMKIDSDNLLVLDTQNSEDSMYYGTTFIDGVANFTGLTDQLTIDVNAKTMPQTNFVVPLKDVQTADSYRLIHFKSKETKTKEKQQQIALEAVKGLSLNINLEVTKDATAQVVIDEVNGSQLTGNGAGDLMIEIDTRGKFNMFGDYTISSGVYDFKYGGIVNKPFLIQKGGAISWNGNPYEANLDVTAVYKAKANPGVLLPNFNSNRKIEVDLVTRITGGLFSSSQDLDIQLTNVDPIIASELEFVLNDNNVNEKTTQFVSLLAFDNFVNPDKVDFNAGATISSRASSALAAAFSSLLSRPDDKFQLGLDYQQGNRGNDIDRLNTDNQVDVSVSTQLGDKVIINGKVGVPVGAQTQSSVVGEVKVEVLLNEEGNFRGVIFNRQNEIQYSTEEEGYTQGVGLSYQVNFNTLSSLLKKIATKKKNRTNFIAN